MSEHDDGGPAFPEPVAVSPTGDVYRAYGGMTLRDYFVAHLAGGLMANPQVLELLARARVVGEVRSQVLARLVNEHADALLEERNK